MKRFVLLALLAVVALVGGGQAATASSKSKKCTPQKVAYVVHGKLVSSMLSKNSDKTYSGTITIHVTKADKHAKSEKGTDKTYTLDHAKGKFGKKENPSSPTVGSRVTLTGKITHLAKGCNKSGFTPKETIKKFDIQPPKKK